MTASAGAPQSRNPAVLSAAETQIAQAIYAVAELGTDPQLTEVMALLNEARDKVAAFFRGDSEMARQYRLQLETC
jgi:hypothetical protein